ncbi:MAG: Crp/Fnr family transcriptional regulator [Maritimibacter sp.]|nr:Crp/Fnr family transcriptional regulator [Maritimibacter sp.]
MFEPDLVENLPPFEGMTSADIREVLRCANRAAFAPDEAVFHEGQEAECFFLLLDGYVRVVRTSEGGQQIISLFIPPGELIGIAAALGRTTYPATAVAATPVAVLAWPMRLWPQISTRHPGFAAATHRTIGGRFTEMNDRLLELSTGQVQHRVARTLLRLAAQSGAGAGNGVEIAFPITRRQISEMSGTTLHTVSRLMSSWEKQGIVESRRKHVAIRNEAELKALGTAS